MASSPLYSSFTPPFSSTISPTSPNLYVSSTISPTSPNLYGFGYSCYHNHEHQLPLPYSQPQPPPYSPTPCFNHGYTPLPPYPYGYTSARSSENYNTYGQQPTQLDSPHVGASEISVLHLPTPMASTSPISFSNSTIPMASQPRLDLFVAMQESICDIKKSLLALLDAVREAERSPMKMMVNQTPTPPPTPPYPRLQEVSPPPPLDITSPPLFSLVLGSSPSPTVLKEDLMETETLFCDLISEPKPLVIPPPEPPDTFSPSTVLSTTPHLPSAIRPPPTSEAYPTSVNTYPSHFGKRDLVLQFTASELDQRNLQEVLCSSLHLTTILNHRTLREATNNRLWGNHEVPVSVTSIITISSLHHRSWPLPNSVSIGKTCNSMLFYICYSLLSDYSLRAAWYEGVTILAHQWKCGADLATNLWNSLLNFYVTRGFPNSAHLVFAEMPEQNAILFPLYFIEPWHILEQENAKLRFGGVPIIQLPYGPRDMYLQVKSLWPHVMANVDHSLHHLRGNIVYTTLVMYEHEPSTIELWKAVCSQLWKLLHVSDGPSRAASITVSHYFANSLVIFSHLTQVCSYYLLNDSTFQLYGEDFVSITKWMFTEINLSHSLETIFTICHAYLSPIIGAWNRLIDLKMSIVWVILLSMLHAMTLFGGIISAGATFGHKDVMLCQNFGQENCRRWNQGEFGQEIESKRSNIFAAVMRMFDGAVGFALFSQRMNTKIGKQWDPSWHSTMSSEVSPFQIKQWDPGKFFKSHFYNLEDMVGLDGQWNVRNNTKGYFSLNEDVGPAQNDDKPKYPLIILVVFCYICKNVILDPSNDW